MATHQTNLYEAQAGKRYKPVPAQMSPILLPFTFKFAAAGLENDLLNLCRLPPGHVRVLANMSRIYRTAFGNGSSVDIGWLAYKTRKDVDKAASVDGLRDGQSTVAAGEFNLNADGNFPWYDFDSIEGVTLQAKFLGAAPPAAAEFNGMIAYLLLPA